MKTLLTIAILLITASASHIDNLNNELTAFTFDKVNFRLQKDCSLDKIPDVIQ